MERTELVEEIVRRVTARLHELEGAEQADPSESKQGLLILTQEMCIRDRRSPAC